MKRILWFSVILNSLSFTAHAYAPNYPNGHTSTSYTREAIKFGVRIIDGVNLFAEYKFTDQLGLQSGLGHKNLSTKQLFGGKIYPTVGGQIFEYLRLLIVFRYYPMKTNEFCFFTGGNFYYILSANSYQSGSNKPTDLLVLTGDEKPRDYNMGLNIGFDYETRSGFILGIRGELILFDVIKKPKPVKVLDQAGFVLGYNFAKMLK